MSLRHRIAALLVASLVAAFLIRALLPLNALPDLADRVSHHYLDRGLPETGAVNIVAAVLLDYRAFDTLGETIVILAAALAVGVLLGRGRLPEAGRGLSPLVQRGIAVLTPLFWLFPVYIVANGHLSPGGGFQGGVGLATLWILLTVVYGTGVVPRALPPESLPKIEYAAALGFLGVGLFGLARIGAFLANRAAGFPLGLPGTLSSAGAMPALNAIIAVKVMAGLTAIFFYLQRDEDPSV